MSDFYSCTPIRLPVKFVQGRWEFFYGGLVPVKEGTIADLIVQKESITDPKFLRAIKKRSVHKFLDQGTSLMVALSIRQPLPVELQKHLVEIPQSELSEEYFWSSRPVGTRFVKIDVGAPTEAFARRHPGDGAGMWLQREGTVPKGLVASSILVSKPISDKPLASLNHAFTRLSEIFEPWRRSHTGNIYTRILYRESNGRWYPLERLRRAAEATEEHALIKARWAELVALYSQGLRP